LDECILGDEFNVFIKAPEDISDVAFQALVESIFFISNLFVLVNNVFKDDSDECDQSNDE